MISIPVEGEVLFRTREEILQEMLDAWVARVPDVYLGEEGNLRLLLEVDAGVKESVFLALSLLSDDIFIRTASPSTLDRKGEEYGVPRKLGSTATGTLRFSGAGGTVINIGDEVAYDPGTGEDVRYFVTTAAGTIPNPGEPTAPVATDRALAGNLTGLMEYVVTFLTAAGETLPSVVSNPVNVAASQIRLTAVPTGGVGTTGRRIYRSKDGGDFKLVTTINNNATVLFDDNVADGGLGAVAPETDTAHRITLAAAAEQSGDDFNVLANTVTILTNVPDGITEVTNTTAFTGGTEPEAEEDYRLRLLNAVRSPQTGSAADIRSWALEIEGVETVAVYPNDNLGVATNGHVTVRFSVLSGGIPDAGKIAEVQAALEARDIANVTFHTAGFTATPTNVTVTITVATGYVLADVSPAVTEAISSYINSLEVGETLRLTGIIESVYGLPGVLDLVVNSPVANQATGATAKRTVGTITVN